MTKKAILIGLTILFLSSNSKGQELIDRNYETENINYLLVANINGNLTVKASKVSQINMQAKSPDYGTRPIPFTDTIVGDTLVIYLDIPGTKLNLSDRGWVYDWQGKQSPDIPTYDIELEVVEEVSLILSTIHEGDIEVSGSLKPVIASNINGSIKISGATSKATTINGLVDIHWDSNPQDSVKLYSLNGDITLVTPHPFDADVQFSSRMGEFFTNIEKHQVLPNQPIKKQKGSGTILEIKGTTIVFGAGGPHLDCETFNGNVIIKHKN